MDGYRFGATMLKGNMGVHRCEVKRDGDGRSVFLRVTRRGRSEAIKAGKAFVEENGGAAFVDRLIAENIARAQRQHQEWAARQA